MIPSRKNLLRSSIIISSLSFVLFLTFYVLSALKYPGGTYANPRQNCFSFTENYLCDLLDDSTYLLQDNPAKLYARIALGFLCLGILLFWLHLPYFFKRKSLRIQLMRLFGMAAMLVTAFLNPGNHDLITFLAGGFGSIALIMAFSELYRDRRTGLLIFGITCLLMILTNYYIYETRNMISILPLFQKITTVAGLSWFTIIGIKLFSRPE